MSDSRIYLKSMALQLKNNLLQLLNMAEYLDMVCVRIVHHAACPYLG